MSSDNELFMRIIANIIDITCDVHQELVPECTVVLLLLLPGRRADHGPGDGAPVGGRTCRDAAVLTLWWSRRLMAVLRYTAALVR